jgi:hypothetical protein
MDLKTGDMVLVSSKGWLSKLIQWFQGNKWNHAGIVINSFGENYVCEATEKGIVFTRINHYLDKPDYYDLKIKRGGLSIPEEQLMNLCLDNTDVGYDFVNLFIHQPIKFISKWIFGNKIWIGAKNNKRAKRRFICGEWVAYCYNETIGLFGDWKSIAPVKLDNHAQFKTVLLVE